MFIHGNMPNLFLKKLKDIALEIPVKLLEEINVNPEKIIELRDTLKKLNNEMSKI